MAGKICKMSSFIILLWNLALFLAVQVQGDENQSVSCYNCVYSSEVLESHECLYPSRKNLETLKKDCSDDGQIWHHAYQAPIQRHDKCSTTFASTPDFGFTIIRTCSRGVVSCETVKEREHEMLTFEDKLIKIFLLSANYCVCEGDFCNKNNPQGENLPYLSGSSRPTMAFLTLFIVVFGVISWK